LQADTAATIPLHDGWNIVSNPFGKPVSWAAVQAANDGPLQPLFGFGGSFAQRDTMASAESGRAFYFLNDQGLSQLTIPYPGAPQQSASGATLASQKTSSGAVSITASIPGEKSASSTVRVHPRSEKDKENRKIVAPPRRLEAVSLRVRDESAKNPRREFLSSTSRDLTTGQTIPLSLEADTSVVRVRASLSGLDGKSVALINQSSGQSWDLDGGRTAMVNVSGKSSRLTLGVGTDAYVDDQVQAAAPESVKLTTAPNPFRQRTTIRYGLPSESAVQLEIYDALGRQVATLVNSRREAGTHRVQFSAQGLSSGVYFGRLKVDGKVVTSKLTVVR
jgi:hypothetical protein